MSAEDFNLDGGETGPNMFRAAMDASPHGIALRRGDAVLYSNPAWDVLMKAERTAADGTPLPNDDIATSSYGFDYRGALLNLTLAHDVSERRKAEQQLQEAQKLEALGRWVGGVVHDFNNLLTAITLYSELAAQSGDGTSAAARYNDEIRAVAVRGAGLTSQLLSFLQQRANERAVISTNLLLKGLRDVLERMTGEDVQVVFELAPESCQVQVDPAQLQQVVFNLVLNARDAMAGGGTLKIRTFEEDADLGKGLQSCVGIVVSDNGCGMDPATRARIFDPFFTTKPRGKGTGLGLSTVRDIVAEAGGKIEVQSEVGAGTAVLVTLPRADSVQKQEAAVTCAEPPAGSETILVVEDDTAVRASIVKSLSRCGYKMLEARSGDEALGVARDFADEIDLLVTDLVLPGISGRDLARRLARVRSGMRILFISGYGVPCDSSGNEIIFEKPFNTEALATRVRQVLDAKTAVNPR